jgi:hypothetical protein
MEESARALDKACRASRGDHARNWLQVLGFELERVRDHIAAKLER